MTEVGAELVVDEVELDAPRAGEVCVEIRHCGVCHSDLHYLDGALRTGLPVVLGHEAAGVVAEVGPGVTDLAPGDTVVLTMAPSCGRCYWCARDERTLCQKYAGLVGGAYPDGSTRLSWRGQPVRRGLVLSAFAERTVVTRRSRCPGARRPAHRCRRGRRLRGADRHRSSPQHREGPGRSLGGGERARGGRALHRPGCRGRRRHHDRGRRPQPRRAAPRRSGSARRTPSTPSRTGSTTSPATSPTAAVPTSPSTRSVAATSWRP